MHNQNVGRLGERKAEEYYLKSGYSFLFRNYRTPFGEIDLIFRKNLTTVFVEVKCRGSILFGRPEEAITTKKLNSLRKGIEYYLLLQNNYRYDCRIDVVSIILSFDGEVSHFEVFENCGV